MRARTIGATVLGTLVLTATAASAAGLTWSSAQLAAAGAAVPACTPALPTTPYVLDSAGLVTAVRVVVATRAGVCDTGAVTVSLRGVNGTDSVGAGSLTLPSSTACADGVCTVPITTPAPGLETVKATHVLQTGA